MTHTRFPPGGSILVPLSSKAACRAGISIWWACRPAARALRSTAYHTVGLLGTLPMRLMSSEEWRPPVEASVWEQMTGVWSTWFGPFDELALHRPPQAERKGFAALLLNEGQSIGFVKCRPDWDFAPEASVIEVVSNAKSFKTASLVGLTSMSGWAMMGLTPIGPGLHTARLRRSPEAVTRETSELLTSIHPTLPEKSHWEPMHGDMGPWNLRYLSGEGFVLFDWEHSRRGPPGADLVFHAAACAAMGLPRPRDLNRYGEAAAFWIEEIPRRFGSTSTDQRMATQMLGELNRLL